jgi:hypothetical protein
MGDIKEFKGRIDVKYIEEIIDNLSEEEILKLLSLSDKEIVELLDVDDEEGDDK